MGRLRCNIFRRASEATTAILNGPAVTVEISYDTLVPFSLTTIQTLNSTAAIPEPSTLALASLSLLSLVGCGRRRRRVT